MHVSGHASQEELKLMLTLMKPKFFIPIHGEYRMLFQHRLLAESVGVDKDNIFLIRNGDVVDIQKGKALLKRKVQAGNTLVDGWGIGDVGTVVLRDRRHLAEDGILVVVITISRSEGAILSGPDIISRGFVYVRESEGLLEEIHRLALQVINEQNENGEMAKSSILKHKMKDALSKYLYVKTKRRPMILPIVIEI
ncbi:Ribonuclease J 2 [compost metagenome]